MQVIHINDVQRVLPHSTIVVKKRFTWQYLLNYFIGSPYLAFEIEESLSDYKNLIGMYYVPQIYGKLKRAKRLFNPQPARFSKVSDIF